MQVVQIKLCTKTFSSDKSASINELFHTPGHPPGPPATIHSATIVQPAAMELLAACHWILGSLAVAFVCYSWLWKPPASSREKGEVLPKLPPEPAGAWPVVGHLPLLGGKEIAARTLGRMADLYGPVFMLRLGVHRTLVISNQEAARECFTTHDRDLASRPRSAAAKHMAYEGTMVGLAPYGPQWRLMRRMATSELLSSARVDELRHVRVSEVGARMGELHQLCTEGGGRAEVEMKQWFNDTTFNVIVRMVVGRRYFGIGAVDGGGVAATEQMRRFQRALEQMLYLAGVFVPSDAVPWLEWLDLRGYIKAMKRTARELEAAVLPWIVERRQKKKLDSGEAKGEKDLIDLLVSATESVDLAGLDPNIAIKGTVLNLILGGTQPSSVAMMWVLSLLLNHRRVLDKVRQEIDLHVGTCRNVEEKDIPKLVYLHAVLKETMRLYPPGPLSAPHEATADCWVGGYHVPAGTRLLTNLWKLHRDPRVWADPDAFRPERFLVGGDAAAVDFRGQHFQYLPFGSGRRMCPGISLALQVTQLTLARLVHGFEMQTPGGAPVDMGEGLGMHVTKVAPLEVHLTPRLPPHLYYQL